jgi:hypothetical protein
MDKEFWATIAKNDYAIPAGHALSELKEVLFGYLGSTDPELRDDIAYVVYANWLKREMFTKAEVHTHVDELLANLDQGIGETESDSVFLRSFSVLLLAEIVHNDNKKPLLEKDRIQNILAKGLWYLEAEKDPRGYIPVKGWAHALAHTADLMLVLGKNRNTGKADLENILLGIANKLIHSTNWVYIHGEDERLANAAMTILRRDLITQEFLRNWLKSFIEPKILWKNAYIDEERARAFHNVRDFLRSVLMNILSTDELSSKEDLQAMLMATVDALVPY